MNWERMWKETIASVFTGRNEESHNIGIYLVNINN
jgi:hypothetical protein